MTQFSNDFKTNAAPVYVGKFNLSHHPFSSQFNSTLYFENEGRKIISKKVAHLLDFTNLILFIQGANGLGKTTLIRQRIRHAKDAWRVCYVNANKITTPQALMTKITGDMNIKFSQSTQVQSIQEQLVAMQHAGLNPILFIDDIERLNKSLIPTIRSLIEYSDNDNPKLKLVISGQDIPPALADIIPQSDGNSMLKYVPLPPLTEKETTSYIKYRLQVSGYEYLEPFNKTQLNKIYLDAKGFPTFINQLSDHLFTQYTLDYDNKKPTLNFNEKTNKILKYAAGGLGVLVLTFVLYTAIDSIDTNSKNDKENLKTQQLQIPTIFEGTTTTIAAAPAQKKQPAVKKKPKNIEPPKIEQKEKIEKKTKPEVKKILTPKKTVAVKAAPKTVKTRSTIEKTKQNTPVRNKKIKRSIKNESWIKAKNPKHYTLQLISGSNRKAATKFIKKHKLEKHAAIFHTKRKGKDWYSVIYKSFKNSKAASRAIKKLPRSLRRIKPWPRPFSAIQKSIR